MKYITTIDNREYTIEIDQDDRITLDGRELAVDVELLPEGLISLLLEHRSHEAVVEERADHWEVLIRGELYTVQVQDERAYRLAKARGAAVEVTGDATIRSPMPGLIVATPAAEGQPIRKGDKVVILESMKMENELRSPRDGIVRRLMVAAGQSVEKDQVLAVIGDSDDEAD